MRAERSFPSTPHFEAVMCNREPRHRNRLLQHRKPRLRKFPRETAIITCQRQRDSQKKGSLHSECRRIQKCLGLTCFLPHQSGHHHSNAARSSENNGACRTLEMEGTKLLDWTAPHPQTLKRSAWRLFTLGEELRRSLCWPLRLQSSTLSESVAEEQSDCFVTGPSCE